METLPGKYVVIEGHDGTGKTTQVERVRERLADRGIASIELHEPAKDPKDGTEDILIADAIRTVIKNGSLKRDAATNLFLFSAARHELWHQKALPALESGKWVIAARNYYSTEAYQGFGEGLDLDLIYKITELATDKKYMEPDIAIILDLDNERERKKRIASRGELENPDTFESRGDDFQMRVKQAYLNIAKKHKVPVLSAAKNVDEVSNDIWEIIAPRISDTPKPPIISRLLSTMKSLLTDYS